MNVGKLVEKLKMCNQKAEVYINIEGYSTNIIDVEENKDEVFISEVYS